MKAMVLEKMGPIEGNPLKMRDIPLPIPDEDEILVRINACGICHTDLHVIEGDLPQRKLPVVPGHQIVGIVQEAGKGVLRFKRGDRVGIPWLYQTCGKCRFCVAERENLCEKAQFTGWHVDGGYAEAIKVHQDFAYAIPEVFSDNEAAPLLCAGVIGYRALRLSGAKKNSRLGLYGFGASAHIVLQVALHMGCEVYVFSRSEEHRGFARRLGATWAGGSDDSPPEKLDSAIIFAPAGRLVPEALRVIDKAGEVVLAGIHMTPIPEMEYHLIYHERVLRSVANSTRKDVEDFLKIAGKLPISTSVETFALGDANSALERLKRGRLNGAGVLQITY